MMADHGLWTILVYQDPPWGKLTVFCDLDNARISAMRNTSGDEMMSLEAFFLCLCERLES